MTPTEIRTLNLAELTTVIDWVKEEGWNPGIHDAEAFFSADPEGFIGGFIDGELVASISAVRYRSDFAFIGLYIVRPNFRRQRLTKILVDIALERTQGIVTGIDGVVAMQQSYAHYGFRIAHRNIRFEGVLASIDGTLGPCAEIENAEPIRELDLECFGAARDEFIQKWVSQKNAITLMVDHGKGKRGFATVRKCARGYKIAPLFADSPEIALQLFAGIKSRLGSDVQLSIDVPEPNQEAIGLVGSLGMSPAFETARMYDGKWDIPLSKVFGLTSFELG